MTDRALALEYLRQADALELQLNKLKQDKQGKPSKERREIDRKIRMLYEIIYELKCISKRLREGQFDGFNSYSH